MIEKWEDKYADVMESEIVTSQQITHWQDEELELLRAEVERLKQGQDYTRAVIRERDALLAENAKLSDLWSVMKAERDVAIQLGKALEEQRDALRKELGQ
jgi:hypothetical protein